MKSQWMRYTVVAIFACLLGVLAHASISRAVQDNRDGSQAQAGDLGSGFSGLEARLVAQQSGQSSGSDEPLENALLQKLWEVIDQADDLSSNERSEARAILEEADPILTRIKRDNARGIEIVKNPPRRVYPKRPAPAQPAPGGQAESPKPQ